MNQYTLCNVKHVSVIVVHYSGAQRVRIDSMDSEKQREFENEGQIQYTYVTVTSVWESCSVRCMYCVCRTFLFVS